MRWLALTFAATIAAAIVVIATAGPTAGGARAQERAPVLTINQVEAGTYPNVQAVVTVLDANGLPALNLPASAFTVSENGQALPQPSVQSTLATDVPLAVVLVLDTSGSMADGGKMDAAKAAAVEFVNRLGPSDKAMLLTFADSTTPATTFTADKAQLVAAINALVPAGNTALFEAATQASFYAASAVEPRKAIVFMSDGENVSNSDVTQEGALTVAREANIPQYTVAFGADADTSFLSQLAAQTRGQYRVAQPASISEVYDSISTLLRSQYIVSARGNGTADGQESSLEVIAAVDGGVAAASIPFNRGAALPVTAVPPPASGSGAIGESDDGGLNIPLITFSAMAMLVLAVVASFFILRWRRDRAVLQHQLAVVEPNPRQAAAQPLPRATGAMAMATEEQGPGRLVEQTASGPGRVYELGTGAAIGTSRRDCTIVLPPSEHVAPEHARLWLRDGKYLLHHAGGLRRKTLVAGKEVDWVTLEPGDEITIGPHRFVYEETR